MPGDIYTQILDIPAGTRPPHHYDILRLELFESDGKRIHAAGLKQMQKLKRWQLHTDPRVEKRVQTMLNEVGRACTVLEVGEKKTEYDRQLADQLGVKLEEREDYDVLTVEDVPLQNCPNCGARMSQLAMYCIECGLDLRYGKTRKTVIEAPPAPELGVRAGLRERIAARERPSLSATLLAMLGRAVKPAFAMAVIGLVGCLLYVLVFRGKEFVVVGYGTRWNAACKHTWYVRVKESELWQLYFAYCATLPNRRRPFIRFTVQQARQEKWYTAFSLRICEGETEKLLLSKNDMSGEGKPGAAIRRLVKESAKALVMACAREDPALVRQLAASVRTADAAAARECIAVLAELGPAAAEAVPILSEIVVEASDPAIQQAALDAVARIQGAE